MKKVSPVLLGLLACLFGTVQAQLFVMTDSLPAAHLNQQSQKLNNGQVLCFGGENGIINDPGGTYASAYLYNNGHWTATGSMHAPRTQFSSVLLQNGKVMAMAGITSDLNYEWASCELYDPSTGQWTLTDSLPDGAYQMGAVVLSNGNVLEADGDSSHIYDPGTGHWSTAVKMAAPHGVGPVLTLMPNGNVLAVGGLDCPFCCDVYNTATNTWTITDSTHYSRYLTSAILLNTGKVLVFGSGSIDSGQTTSELYDPGAGKFTVTGNLLTNVSSSPAVLLDNGNPIVWSIGNEFGTPPNLQTVQIYNVSTGAWFAPPASQLGTTNNTLVKMSNNQVLVIAGEEIGYTLPYCWLINGNAVSGIADIIPGLNFNISPNPGSGYFTVGSGQLPANALIRIYDMQGRMLEQCRQNHSEPVSAGNLAPGAYLIALFSESGEALGVRKWVKM